MRRVPASVLTALLVVASGCGSTTDTVGSVGEPTTTPSEPSSGSAAEASPGTPLTELSPNALPSLTTSSSRPPDVASGEFSLDPDSPQVQAALDDLTTRLGIADSEVTLVEASAVSWPDSSLGCPQPGMQYLQRVTDGSLVILTANGLDYRYTGGNPVVLCENFAGD